MMQQHAAVQETAEHPVFGLGLGLLLVPYDGGNIKWAGILT